MRPSVQAFFDSTTATASYLVCDPASRAAAVVDPVLDFDPKAGRLSTASADALLKAVSDQGLDLRYVLETHVHADHLSAADYIRKRSGAQVVIGARVVEVQRTFIPIFDATDVTPDGAAFDRLLAEGDELPLGGQTISVLDTPGHTPADVTYRIGDAVFVGDTLFAMGCGRMFEGDPDQFWASLSRLAALPDVLHLLPILAWRAFGGGGWGVVLSYAVAVPGQPVRLQYTREDDMSAGFYRPLFVHKVKVGLDDTGNIVAWHHRVVSDEALAYMDPVRFKASQGRDNIAMRGTELPTYDIPHRLAEGLQQPTGIRTAPLRAIGVGQNSFANEVFIDEVAAKAGIDPVEFRIRQLAGTPRAQRGRRVIEEVARMADWGRKREGRGLGVAYLDYSGTQLAGIAEVSLNKDGRIRVHDFWCVIDAGVAIQPDNIIAQTESSIVYGIGLALTEHIDVSGGLVQQSNFFDYHVPRMRDIPNIHIKLVQTPNHPTGAGQMATPLVPSAIANAFHQLTGVRLRQQPLLPGRVQQAMNDAGVKFA